MIDLYNNYELYKHFSYVYYYCIRKITIIQNNKMKVDQTVNNVFGPKITHFMN